MSDSLPAPDPQLRRHLVTQWKQFRRRRMRDASVSSPSDDDEDPLNLLETYKQRRAQRRMGIRKKKKLSSDSEDEDPKDQRQELIAQGGRLLDRLKGALGREGSDSDSGGSPQKRLLTNLRELRDQFGALKALSVDSDGDARESPVGDLGGRRRRHKSTVPKRPLVDNSDTFVKKPPTTNVRDAVTEEGQFYGMVKESTAWDVYTNEAKKVDTELVKDWRESLNSLLLFTAIFAAVLAGFIIESKKMLQQDPTDLLASLTLFSINNNGNVSNLPFVPTPFEPTWTAVSINSLFFGSLGVTLVAALASVISLQWVTDYDAAITRGGSSPEDRAKRRQFRFSGVVDWKMGEIIAALPLLLYSSVFLFLAGAIQWMVSIHHVVGYVVVFTAAIAVSFYAITTFLAAAFVTAPFRTPLSRGIHWFLRPTISSAGRMIAFLKVKTSNQQIAFPTRPCMSVFRQQLARIDIERPFSRIRGIGEWVHFRFVPKVTSRRREDDAAGLDPALGQRALGWLSQHLPISADSHRRLMLLITEVLNLPPDSARSSSFLDESWLGILNFLGWYYMRQIINKTLSEDDYDAVGLLLRCSTAPEIRDQISPSSTYETNPVKSNYWDQCGISTVEAANIQVKSSENMTFLLARDVPIPSDGARHELEATMKLISWRNSTAVKCLSIWQEVFRNSENYSAEYVTSSLHYYKLWALSSPENLEPSKQLAQTAIAFEMLVGDTTDPELHHALVRIMRREVEQHVQEQYNNPAYIATVRDKLSWLRDPCLAILGAFGYGIPVSVEVRMTKAYMEKYTASIKIVRSLVYKQLRPGDSAAIWQLRASVSAISPRAIVKLCYKAARDPQQMPYLERIFEHPVHCSGHTSGSHHLLYHFNCDNTTGLVMGKGESLYGLDMTDKRAHPVLMFLAFGPQLPSFLTLGMGVNPDSVERLRKMCEAAMQDSVAVILLVTDIVKDHLKCSCEPRGVALVLKAVETALALPDKDGVTLLLRPMAGAIRRLKNEMKRDAKGSKGDIKAVARQADRICARLKAAACARVVSSISSSRFLSCARSITSAQPAVGWISMYDGVSKDEVRIGSNKESGSIVGQPNPIRRYTQQICRFPSKDVKITGLDVKENVTGSMLSNLEHFPTAGILLALARIIIVARSSLIPEVADTTLLPSTASAPHTGEALRTANTRLFRVKSTIERDASKEAHTAESSSGSTSQKSPPAPPIGENFDLLVYILTRLRHKGKPRPYTGTIEAKLTPQPQHIYERAGVTTFKEYASHAERMGIIRIGGDSDGPEEQWMELVAKD